MTRFSFGFSFPLALWLLALLPLLYFISLKSLVSLSPLRRWMALGLRAAILALLILALAGAQWVRYSEKLCTLFLVDGSDSVRADANKEVVDKIAASFAAMTSKDEAGIVLFGEDAVVELPPAAKPAFKPFETIPSRRRTDIARALRLAAGLFPDDAEKRVVLFTDGNENVGLAEREARTAAANQIQIEVAPVERSVGGETLVERVTVPEREDVDKPFDIKVVVDAAEAGPAALRLFRDGAFVAKQDVALREGKNIFTVAHTEKDSGFHTYEAMIESARDAVPDNNRAAAFSLIKGQSRALLIGEDGDTRYLAKALAGDKIPAVSERSAPLTMAQAENYDAIILANVPATSLSEEQMKILSAYARDLGGGLGMIGGENSFGPGGYAKTAIEEAMPVSMELKDRMQFPSLAMVMVIDKSGSMSEGVAGGETKVKLACAAAARAIELMSSRDRVGVIAFDSAAKWVQTMADATAKQAIIDTVFSITAGGGTSMYPGLQMAAEALAAEQAQVKHIIALTDGRTEPGDWARVAGQMNAAGITLSTVAIGPGADKALLQQLAQMGKGRYYETADPRDTPRIFSKETIRVQRSYVIERDFVPFVAQAHEILKGVATAAMPPLKGFVATEKKPRAEEILRSTVKGNETPVLAVWQHGLGRTLAFTSDAKNKWAADWIGWEGFGKLWPQCVRWLMRGQQQGALHPRVAIEGDRGKIVVDAIEESSDQFINFLSLTANVVTPSFETERIALRQTGPGRYEGEFAAPKDGAYIATVAGGGQPVATAGTVVSYPPEYGELKSNRYLMSQVAEATDGRVDTPPAEWFRHRTSGIRSPQDIWYPLVWAALLLIPFDVGVRRVRLEPEHWAALRAFVSAFIPFVGSRQRTITEDQLAALKATKQRARANSKGSGVPEAAPGPSPQRPPKTKPGEIPSPSESLFIHGDVADRLAAPAPTRPSAQPSASSLQPPAPSSQPAASENRLLAARERARKRMGNK